MPSSLLTIPNARSRLSEAMGQYNTASVLVIDRVMGGRPLRAADDTYIRLVELLRTIDGMRYTLRAVWSVMDGERAEVVAMAKALRSATYLALISIVPEEAAYWSEENQTRISLEASELTLDKRSDIIRETLEFESRPPEDPDAYAASQEELALWDSVVGDGIWTSSTCRLV